MPLHFPAANTANEDGIVAIGGGLDVALLEEAYKNGIFPWPMDPSYPLTWFSPDPRGILNLEDFKVPKSTIKLLKKKEYSTHFNKDFLQIITACAQAKRENQQDTWIHDDLIESYHELFIQGHAYCLGTYEKDQLVGGLYGVCFGELISGESMFYNEDGASKFALISLVEQLKGKGIKWIDTQMVTPLLKSFGAIEIERDQFLNDIKELDYNITRKELF